MLRKYSLLLIGFFKASAVAELEYRLNFVLKVIGDICWYLAQISIFEVLFIHTRSLSGWTLESTRVFLALVFLTDCIWMIFLSENLGQLSEKVRTGDLDLLLAKPVNAQFMLSFQRMSPSYLVNLGLVLGFFAYALNHLAVPVPLSRLLLLFVLVPAAVAITYGCRLFFSASAFLFENAENLNYVWYQLYRLGTRPHTLFPPWLRYVVLTVLPVGFIASVPASLILAAPNWILFFGAITAALVSVFLSTRYWRFAVRRYSSTSS